MSTPPPTARQASIAVRRATPDRPLAGLLQAAGQRPPHGVPNQHVRPMAADFALLHRDAFERVGSASPSPEPA